MITRLLIFKILQLFAVMVVGFAIAKFKIVKTEDASVLSKIALYLLTPSAIFNAFDFERSPQTLYGLALAFLAATVLHTVFCLMDLPYRKFISSSPAERATAMYSNAGNLIIPIVSYVLGAEWVIYSTAFLSVQLLFLWTHGIKMFSPNEKFNAKKILLNPNTIAIFSGILLMLLGIRLPEFVKGTVSSFGDMVGTVGMLVAGILAANVKIKSLFSRKGIFTALIARLAVYPLVSLVIIKLLALIPVADSHRILLITYFACITPAAATVTQFAQIKNNDPECAVTLNILSTVGCIVTMPLLVSLYQAF